jgi:putative protease
VKLRDRVGAEHPVKADVGCRNTVFNSRVQTGAEYLARLLSLGLRFFRIEFLSESATEVEAILAMYQKLLAGKIAAAEVRRHLKLWNQLGVTRSG